MPKKRILVLGAGLAGLSAAWHLQKKKIDCAIFEKNNEAGGLCRSKKIGGFVFDYSGHLLHFRNSYAFNLTRRLLGENLLRHKRSAWIYSHDKFTPYPFQANLFALPPRVAKECILGFLDSRKRGFKQENNKQSFLKWINATFGKGIARHFMVPYNTKFWTVAPAKLTCEWLDGFIPVPSLEELLDGAVGRSPEQIGYNALFWYPRRGGIIQLASALASQINHLYTKQEVIRVDPAKKEITISGGRKEKFDYIISTIPLPELANMIKGVPSEVKRSFKKLRWNSIFNLNLGIENADLTDGKHWIYFPQRGIHFYRVGFYHNFSPFLAPLGKGSVYIEVSYSESRPINRDSIIPEIEQDLRDIGMINPGDEIYVRDSNDIKYGYPIYDGNYSAALKKIFVYLSRNSIIPAGRYGSWRYLSMEDVLLGGRRISEDLINLLF